MPRDGANDHTGIHAHSNSRRWLWSSSLFSVIHKGSEASKREGQVQSCMA